MISLIYTTLPSLESAKEISEKLLEERVIACANILGVGTSLYIWEGKVDSGEEAYLLLKTTCPEKAKKSLETLHPYEMPAILTWGEVEANKAFELWVQDVCSGKEVR